MILIIILGMDIKVLCFSEGFDNGFFHLSPMPTDPGLPTFGHSAYTYTLPNSRVCSQLGLI